MRFRTVWTKFEKRVCFFSKGFSQSVFFRRSSFISQAFFFFSKGFLFFCFSDFFKGFFSRLYFFNFVFEYHLFETFQNMFFLLNFFFFKKGLLFSNF